ncbi:MAG TPA: ATP-binding protein [Prolixibacteraceae bacterium]|jgi:MinD superfamily P-loop ATPase|nr:ATP-binding protein [Prolixibacteraceae bacterium]
MNEIVVLSGKGGTGKTMLSAAFATLEKNVVVADCDVDAANLHLILQPKNEIEEVFVTGHRAQIDYNKCTNCGLCVEHCRFDAISIVDGMVKISETSCDGCKLCSRVCPIGAIEMVPSDKSRWYAGNYRNGKMVHARLAPGEENSGKLVNVVRDYAKKIAVETNAKTIIIDGPPGTGCPVVSSLTGTKKVVLVTEPSESGFHDLKRIVELSESFHIKPSVIINKYDLNYEMTRKIEKWCSNFKIPVIGKILFDKQIVEAMLHCKSIVEWKPSLEASEEIKNIWKIINC